MRVHSPPIAGSLPGGGGGSSTAASSACGSLNDDDLGRELQSILLDGPHRQRSLLSSCFTATAASSNAPAHDRAHTSSFPSFLVSAHRAASPSSFSPSAVTSANSATASSSFREQCAIIEQMRRHTPTRQPFGGVTAFGSAVGAGSFGSIGSLGSHPLLHGVVGTPPTTSSTAPSSVATSTLHFVNSAALSAARPLPSHTHTAAFLGANGSHPQHAPVLLATSMALGQQQHEPLRRRAALEDDDQSSGGGMDGSSAAAALPESGEIFEFE
jgi:hypothetical protein